MPWKITLHEKRPEKPQVGDMWPAEHMMRRFADIYADKLSPRYHALPEPRRDPLVVRLPGGTDFCVDTRAWTNGVYYGDGWAVTGPLDAMTMMPSVNIPGAYHGWIRGGVISDDVEGRRFDAAGARLP